MPTTDFVDVSETATASTTEGGSRGRNITIKRKGLSQPDVRKSPSKITVRSGGPRAKRRLLIFLPKQKKKQTKKAPPRGAVRDFPCRPCVTRATKAPGHECASQDSTLG